jgi:hypothetical protein
MSYPDSSYTPAPQTPEPRSPDKRKRNRLIGILAVVLALLLCSCVAVAALLYFDPFGWGLLSRFTGRYDAVAQAAPIDSTMYVGVNLLNVTPDKINPFITVFQDAFEEYTGENVTGSDDFMDPLNDGLDEFDLTVEDDILPWIGQYAGMGILDMQLDSYGYTESVDFFIAAEARDRNAADAFLLKLSDGIADSWDVNVDTTQYQDTTIYVVDEDYAEMAFARHNSLVILANSEDSIQDVIDAQKGDSIADDPVYRDLMSQLPAERVLSFYLPASALGDLSSAATSGIGVSGSYMEDLYAGTSGMALSLSLVDLGLQLDSVVAYAPDAISDSQRQLLDATGRANDTADRLPGDTFAYLSGQRLDLAWATYYEVLSEATEGDFDEALSQLDDQIGFNPHTDLFPYLDGSYALAIFPSDSGFLVELADIHIGFAIIAQTSDETAVMDVVDSFNDALEENGGGEVDDVSTGSMTLYEATDTYMDEPIMVYGVGEGWLGIASSLDVFEAFPNPPDALNTNENYRTAQNYLPGGMNLIAYVDLLNALDAIRDNMDGYDREDFDESTFFLNPIETLVAGASPFSGNTVHSTIILVIPTQR